MNMSGIGYGTTVASVNNWIVPGAPDPWTKVPTNTSTTSENVNTLTPTDMYERSVISSTSPPVSDAEINQNHSRLRSLLTRPKVRETHQSKEDLKSLRKGQSATTQANMESNYLLKGILSSGVKHQNDHLLGSFGFHSPPTCDPTSPQNYISPAFSQNSPICETSPLSCQNSPSPTGSLKRTADDDVYIERQIIKKKCYSPPSFHFLPSSSVQTNGKEGAGGSTLCEKNKMLASLLATQPTTPATIPPLPQSALTATPQERLPRLPQPRTKQNSAAVLWSGGRIKLKDPGTPPLATSPTVDEYLLAVSSGTMRQESPETFPVNTGTQAYNLVSLPSSPKVENCYQNNQQRNQTIAQRQGTVNQQMSFPCKQEDSWRNYCGQESLSTTRAQNNSVWHEQMTAQRKLTYQGSEGAVANSNNYNATTTSQYNTYSYSYEHYNQLQMRQGQNNNAQLYLLQQQQLLTQQQQISQQTCQQQQQRCCSLEKGYFNTHCQETVQQMTGWNGYSGNQGSSMLCSNDASSQNYRTANYQESVNSFKEYWDMQNSEPEPVPRQVMTYNQNRGQTVSERKYIREGTADSTAPLELPSVLSEIGEVPAACNRPRNGGLNKMQQMLAKNPNLASKNDELRCFGENDNDLAKILDYILDNENLGKNSQGPRRQQRNNILTEQRSCSSTDIILL